MKYQVSITYTFIADEQQYYDSLIEDGYLPDEAKYHIVNSLHEMAQKIDEHVDNIIYFPYYNNCVITKLD